MKKTVILLALIVTILLTSTGCIGKTTYFDDNSDVFRIGESNNGVDKYSQEMDRLTSVVPTDRQLAFSEIEYYNFIHFGINTFADEEWSDGTVSVNEFNPSKLSTDQWCETLLASGSKGIILTAKHHDGFCLWQTDTTEYSIKNSPYKNGQGDIVKELAESCKKYGLKFGVYLSPWDRNAPSYGHNEYNDFYIEQLTELLTNYGDIFSVWFDGARGDDAVLDADFAYDWERIYAKVRELQPNAVMCVSGPDVRWVGNEAGVSRKSEWSVVSAGQADPDKVAEGSQKNEAMADELQKITYDSEDLGSRDLLKYYNELKWYPAEVDVSIRKGWFWHKNQKPKSVKKLLDIYYKAVGGNSSLLLNVPPNREGLIDDKDVKVLKEFGEEISKAVENKISYSAKVGKIGEMRDMSSQDVNVLLTDNLEGIVLNDNDSVIDLKLSQTTKVKFIHLREDLRYSQRIEYFDVYAKVGDRWLLLANATNVGNRRIIQVEKYKQKETDTIRIVIRQSRKNPVISYIGVYA